MRGIELFVVCQMIPDDLIALARPLFESLAIENIDHASLVVDQILLFRVPATTDTVDRVLPSMWERNSCDILKVSTCALSALIKSQRASLCSKLCIAAQPADWDDCRS